MNREDINSSSALACWVRRCHVWPVIRVQTTGHHSARLCQIYCEIFGMPRAEVFYYALHHDAGELFAGDNPASAKWEVPSLKAASDEAETIGLGYLGIKMPELSQDEWWRFKICDCLELWEYGCCELHMGNKFARPLVVDCRKVALQRAVDAGPDCYNVVDGWIRREEARYGRG